jgi:hypothetical protein
MRVQQRTQTQAQAQTYTQTQAKVKVQVQSPQTVRFPQQQRTMPQMAHHNSGAAPAAMTPVRQPQPSKSAVDSSLFVSTSLRRVEPNPAESPLKRTKLSEEDAMEFVLRYRHPCQLSAHLKSLL